MNHHDFQEDDYDQRNVMAVERMRVFISKFPLQARARGLDALQDMRERLNDLRNDMAPYFAPAVEYDIDDICHQLDRRLAEYITMMRGSLLSSAAEPEDSKLAEQWNVENRKTRDHERKEWSDQRLIVGVQTVGPPSMPPADDDDDDPAF